MRSCSIAACVLAAAACAHKSGEVSLRGPSPDERWLVEVVELWHLFDRNFQIHLVDAGAPSKRVVVLKSADEGWPSGTERILWSKDSRYFLLTGRRFLALRDARLLTGEGETAYFVYDTATGSAWSNSRQLGGFDDLTEKELRLFGFLAP